VTAVPSAPGASTGPPAAIEYALEPNAWQRRPVTARLGVQHVVEGDGDHDLA
jgi:hypothetical protein